MPKFLRTVLVVAVGVVGMAGCHNPKLRTDDGIHRVKLSPKGHGGGRDGKGGRVTSKPVPFELRPTIHAIAMPGARFDRVEFDIGYPILVAKSPAQVTVTPALPGKVVRVSSSRFAFVPKSVPQLDTTYKFVATSVSTTRGKEAPPVGSATFEVHTPKFTFLGADVSAKMEKVGRVRVQLRYSAAPVLADVQRFLTVTKDGEAAKFSVEKSKHETVVEVAVEKADGAEHLQLLQAAGISTADRGGQELVASKSDVAVPTSIVDVKSVQAGALGPRRYIEVFCKDAQEREATVYSPEYEQVSEHCLPENSDAVVVEPRLKSRTVAEVRGGFRIFGPFERGTYTVRFPSRLKTAKESTFVTDQVYPVSFGALDASAAVIGRGRYLPPEAWQSLGLRTRNVLSAQVVVRRIPTTNLNFWLSDSNESADTRNSDIIAVGTLDVTGELDKEQVTYVDLNDLVKGSDRQPGVYEIAVTAGMGDEKVTNDAPADTSAGDDDSAEADSDDHNDDRGYDGDDDGERRRDRDGKKTASDARRFLYTHLNLVAKREQNGSVHVWAFDLDDLEPVGGVNVTLNVPSGRALSSGTTDRGGHCLLAGLGPNPVDPTDAISVIARKGNDTSYLRFSDVEIAPTTSVGGGPYDTERELTAVSYADRGVYRPGDTAHVVVVVRDKKILAPAKTVALEAHLLDPKTRLLRKITGATNSAGAVAFDLPFNDDADTGRYRLEYYAGKLALGEADVQVEEFVPERLNAEVTPQKGSEHKLGEAASFRVSARYLFGGSAEGSAYKLHCVLKPGSFAAPRFDDFTFDSLGLGIGAPRGAELIPVDDVEGKLGKGGVDSASCKGVEVTSDLVGPHTLEAQLAVMEAGSGRATVASASEPIHPAAFYLGLKASTTTLTASQPVTLKGVVVGWNGELKPQARDATVELLLLQHNVYWSRGDNDDAARTDYAAGYSESKQKVSLKEGKFELALTPADPHSDYLVRVRSGKAVTELLLSGSGGYWDDWYYSGGDNNKTPSPERPSVVNVTATGEAPVGRDFPVRFDSRWGGRALVTVETNKILKQEWINLAAGKNEWLLHVDSFVPNVYVSVLAFKNPHAESADAFLPERAFGVTSITVDHSSKRHNVTLTVPKEIRSGANLDVGLDIGASQNGGPVFATVAAVDEGILKLTHFASPDPLGQLFSQRALGTKTYETVGWNVAAPSLAKQIGGGDDEEGGKGEGSRAQPIKPVALWSGLVAVDAQGHAQVHFRVPTYRGALRVMAVTIGTERLGAASSTVLVRDPIVVQTTAPRFLVKDDEADVPVFLSNVSGQAREVTVEMRAEPLDADAERGASGVEIVPQDKKPLKLANGKSATVRFLVRAVAIGNVRLIVRATSGDLTVGEELELPISAGLPNLQKLTSVALKTGTTKVGATQLGAWQAGTDKTVVRVVTNPYAQALLGIDQLLGYPYGCIEQTTSATRPLLAARRLLEEIPPKLPANQSIDARLMAGIARIFSMQTPAGGFAYWPGSSTPNVWGTAYATHFLLDAKADKVDFSQSRLDDAVEFLERTVDGRITWEEYFRWGDNRAEPYVQYVLARAGRGHAGRIIELLGFIDKARDYAYKANAELSKLRDAASLARVTLPINWLDVSSLDEDSYLLKAALYLTGDKRYAADLEKFDLRPIYFLRQYTWSYYSDMRYRALVLSVYGDLFGTSAKAKPLVDLLVETIKAHPYYYFNTQELGWALTAIAKQIGPSGGIIDAKLTVGGVERTAKRATPHAAPTWTVRGLSHYSDAAITVADSGKPHYLLAITEGVPARAEDVPMGAHGVLITREYLDASGSAVDLAHVSLGTVIYVRLSITNTETRSLDNLALVDRLPAGFEIENPRLGRGGDQAEWMRDSKAWSLDYMNLRDDRFEGFGRLGYKQEAHLLYSVRATAAGHFTAPVAQVEAMYDPEVWGRADATPVVVDAE